MLQFLWCMLRAPPKQPLHQPPRLLCQAPDPVPQPPKRLLRAVQQPTERGCRASRIARPTLPNAPQHLFLFRLWEVVQVDVVQVLICASGGSAIHIFAQQGVMQAMRALVATRVHRSCVTAAGAGTLKATCETPTF